MMRRPQAPEMAMEPTASMALRAARKAGDLIVRASDDMDRVGYKAKAAADFVSEVDIAAEKEILYHLSKTYPEHRFECEESGLAGNEEAEYTWGIDPLDGTTNFLYDVPVFAVSIALASAEAIELGVVYECGRDELFSAYQGGGASLNGQAIKVAEQKNLKDSLLATGFPYYDFKRMQEFNAFLAKLYPSTRGLRRMGSAATDLAYVACGRFNAYFEYGLSPWDVAAGILLVQEAGGKVSDFKGESNYLFGSEIIASSSNIYDEFTSLLQEYLPSNA